MRATREMQNAFLKGKRQIGGHDDWSEVMLLHWSIKLTNFYVYNVSCFDKSNIVL